jgi:acyl-homoserine lactone acylase PvdQ
MSFPSHLGEDLNGHPSNRSLHDPLEKFSMNELAILLSEQARKMRYLRKKFAKTQSYVEWDNLVAVMAQSQKIRTVIEKKLGKES